MQITGEWLLCPDEIIRPVVLGEVRSGAGAWLSVPFPLDTGADRTVLSAAVASALNLPALDANEPIGGLGGTVESVLMETVIQLTRETGAPVSFRGRFVAVTELSTLDMSVLGRDITDHFAVLVDRPDDRVFLVRGRHHCAIELA